MQDYIIRKKKESIVRNAPKEKNQQLADDERNERGRWSVPFYMLLWLFAPIFVYGFIKEVSDPFYPTYWRYKILRQ